jgi:hypothetical protein
MAGNKQSTVNFDKQFILQSGTLTEILTFLRDKNIIEMDSRHFKGLENIEQEHLRLLKELKKSFLSETRKALILEELDKNRVLFNEIIANEIRIKKPNSSTLIHFRDSSITTSALGFSLLNELCKKPELAFEVLLSKKNSAVLENSEQTEERIFYQQSMKLISYGIELNAQKEITKLNILGSGLVGPETLKALIQLYPDVFSDMKYKGNSVEEICKTLDRMNRRFKRFIASDNAVKHYKNLLSQEFVGSFCGLRQRYDNAPLTLIISNDSVEEQWKSMGNICIETGLEEFSEEEFKDLYMVFDDLPEPAKEFSHKNTRLHDLRNEVEKFTESMYKIIREMRNTLAWNLDVSNDTKDEIDYHFQDLYKPLDEMKRAVVSENINEMEEIHLFVQKKAEKVKRYLTEAKNNFESNDIFASLATKGENLIERFTKKFKEWFGWNKAQEDAIDSLHNVTDTTKKLHEKITKNAKIPKSHSSQKSIVQNIQPIQEEEVLFLDTELEREKESCGLT